MSEKYPMALPEGTVLAGQYIVDKVLGQGGFGITYMATDHKTGQRVAIKEFFPDALATRHETIAIPYNGERSESFEYGKKCFLDEAQTLAQFIGNENIVKIHTYFEENDTGYFVMDFVEGESLEDYIKQRGRLDWEETARILIPIMDALGAVHARGIVHRDVTPDNIYITTDGTVKLLDFGAARYSIGDKSRSLDIVLKHGFAPKEQYVRRGRQGPFTDVYALGATFYYALTGQRPPDSVSRIDEDELIPPSTLGVKLPEAVENAILQAMSVQAGDRFQTMAAFKRAMKISAEGAKQKAAPVAAPVAASAAAPVAAPVTPSAPVAPTVASSPVQAQAPAYQVPVIPAAPVNQAPQATPVAAPAVLQIPSQPAPVTNGTSYAQQAQPVTPVAPAMQNQTGYYQPQYQQPMQPVQPAHVQPERKSNKAVIGIIIGIISMAAVVLIIAGIVLIVNSMKKNNTVKETSRIAQTTKKTEDDIGAADGTRPTEPKNTSALTTPEETTDTTPSETESSAEETTEATTTTAETEAATEATTEATTKAPTPTAKPIVVAIDTVSASAYYIQNDGKKFTPDLAVDGDLKTAWNVRAHEEVDSDGNVKKVTTRGKGEYIDFYFAPGTELYSITIHPGFCFDDKKAKRFEKNYAPTNVTISSGKASYDIDLKEYAYDLKKATKGYTFKFPKWLVPKDGKVRLTINEVRNIYEEEGKDFWKDCAISEVSFAGTYG